MADRKAEPGAGDVPLTLGGETLMLVPTLEACRDINRMAGGSLSVAIARIMERLDFEFIVDIVALGLDATSPPLKKQIAAKVYRQGVISVAADTVLFVRTVMNGGRRPDGGDADRCLTLLDRALQYVPEGMEEQAQAVDEFRNALINSIAEAEANLADPLPEKPSQSESSTD